MISIYETKNDDCGRECREVVVEAMKTSFANGRPGMISAAMALPTFDARGRRRLVAAMRGVVVGFIDWTPRNIGWLMVHPNAQNKGIGSRLLELVKAESDELDVLCVESNVRALGFYKHAEFRVVRSGVTGTMFGEPFVNHLLRWTREL